MLDTLYRLRFDYRRRRGLAKTLNQLNTGLVNVLAGAYYACVQPKKPGKDASAPPVIVNFTTYGDRVSLVAPCASSLLRQDYGNFRVVLWLSETEYQSADALPDALKKLMARGLEVAFVPDLRSYKKIYFAAERFPDTLLVTADDDFFYPESWLSDLVKTHARYPNAVACHRAHRMTLDERGALAGYKQWDWYANGATGPSHSLHILSGAGALFPVGFFDAAFFDRDAIQACCPTTDDIWLKFHALRRGVPVVKARAYSKSLVCVRGTQETTLYHQNERDRNDAALQALQERFGFSIAGTLAKEGETP